MVTLNLMDTEVISQIIVLVLALGMSYLAVRMGSFMWFLTSFAWVGLAYMIQDNMWLGLCAGGMALLCQAFFIMTASKGR